MNIAMFPASHTRSDSAFVSRGRQHSVIPLIPRASRSTAFADEEKVIEARKCRIFSGFSCVFSFRMPQSFEFETLKRTWKRATRFQSSIGRITSHPAYQRMIGMGVNAIPWILRDLRQQPDFWFEALTAITGEQPVKRKHAGDVSAMAEDWLAWGRRNGYDC